MQAQAWAPEPSGFLAFLSWAELGLPPPAGALQLHGQLNSREYYGRGFWVCPRDLQGTRRGLDFNSSIPWGPGLVPTQGDPPLRLLLLLSPSAAEAGLQQPGSGPSWHPQGLRQCLR